MGSYSNLLVRGWSVLSTYGAVDPTVATVFTEQDRTIVDQTYDRTGRAWHKPAPATSRYSRAKDRVLAYVEAADDGGLVRGVVCRGSSKLAASESVHVGADVVLRPRTAGRPAGSSDAQILPLTVGRRMPVFSPYFAVPDFCFNPSGGAQSLL